MSENSDNSINDKSNGLPKKKPLENDSDREHRYLYESGYSGKVAVQINQVERTVDPDVYKRRKKSEAINKEEIPSIGRKLGYTNIEHWEIFSYRMKILILGIAHGFLYGVVQIALRLNLLPEATGNQAVLLIIYVFISLPLGIYLSDFFSSLYISVIGLVSWFLTTSLLLSIPGFLGLTYLSAASYFFSFVAYSIQYLPFMFLPFVFGLIIPAVISEFYL